MLEGLWQDYRAVRRTTEALCAPLAIEDYVVQAMPEASPAKWHLAHVSWFFETFALVPHLPGYQPLDPRYRVLFNSYYQAVGPQPARPERGHLSRPTVAEVYEYRRCVDEAMADLLMGRASDRARAAASIVELGLHHEQQHQELLLTDIKYALWINPLRPAYRARPLPRGQAPALRWVPVDGGLFVVGHDGKGFAFDNEGPAHQVHLRPYRLASRPVTNGEYRAFIEAGGYGDWRWWLSEGWTTVRARGWGAPLYWEQVDGQWWTHTLAGPHPLDEHAPVCHVSYYEADAYARWRGHRLPTEQEWEHAVEAEEVRGNFLETGLYHPMPAHDGEPTPPDGAGPGLQQVFGDTWEWTQSAYSPYPGFQPVEGALGEYNGKFMVNQLVLRGGSCATPTSHMRPTYRNFFPPDARWQFSGIRLAGDA
ncbi:MAG TPA: ergothioneine biosynthesis protein EgtB [Candidatus Binatia bacterium]|nr:ergothioneine biosynthesis protein EgtB [Candidatus Binatia bacterium]